MKRLCDTCQQCRALCDFSLDRDDGLLSTTCCSCRRKKDAASARRAHRAQLSRLERRRRSLIAALVKVDGEISELRAGSLVPSPRALEAFDFSEQLFDS
jgi:hypothetical protein